jgi:hypothetical protein
MEQVLILLLFMLEEFNKVKEKQEKLEEQYRHRIKDITSKPDLIRAPEFIRLMDICRKTFDNRRRNNEFKVIRIGRLLYVPRTEYERLVQEE